MKSTFLWGAATSAHQVEGNNTNSDWWEFEQKNEKIENSGKADDHYHRYAEDFALAKKLGHNAHRLSVEWARIEPQEGDFDRRELNHYKDVLIEAKKNGLKTFVTLHHFTNPLWMAKMGGWQSSRSPELFARYAKVVAEHLGEEVDFWITINEPMVYASQAYWHRRWPPGKKSMIGLWSVVRNMAQGHKQAYRVIHSVLPNAKVGMSKHLIAYIGGNKALKDLWFNHYFYWLTKNTHDFLGVNFYFTDSNEEWQGEKSDLGWPIRPEGLRHVLWAIKRYNLPIYITENGLADAKDSRRADFIRSHLREIEKVQKKGLDVRGYLHWSLLDNFEWDLGFSPRFGLIEVDYETMERKIRPSAYVYKAIIEQAQDQSVL